MCSYVLHFRVLISWHLAFLYVGRCKSEIKSKIFMAKAASDKKKTLFTSKLDLSLRNKLVKCYIWNMVFYSAGTWTLRKIDQKHRKVFKRDARERCRRSVGPTVWKMKRHTVKDERNILRTVKRKKTNWIGHIVRGNCFLERYWRKDRGKDRSDAKTKKKT